MGRDGSTRNLQRTSVPSARSTGTVGRDHAPTGGADGGGELLEPACCLGVDLVDEPFLIRADPRRWRHTGQLSDEMFASPGTGVVGSRGRAAGQGAQDVTSLLVR